MPSHGGWSDDPATRDGRVAPTARSGIPAGGCPALRASTDPQFDLDALTRPLTGSAPADGTSVGASSFPDSPTAAELDASVP
ncbi:hypothetical protein [Streptomyces canus]|uniref:hypothetical protein n=1 Tax=Streptomyces canus TaxID=58343 RepID=UPI0036EFBEFC